MSNNEYKVGYGHPPVNGRFRKGMSGNPLGRQKDRVLELDALFAGDEEIIRNGKRSFVSAFEAELFAIVKRALEGKSFTHLKRLMDLFLRYGVITRGHTGALFGVVRTPDLPNGLLEILFAKYGLPEWTPEQIAELRPHWVATRDEFETILDELGYWKW